MYLRGECLSKAGKYNTSPVEIAMALSTGDVLLAEDLPLRVSEKRDKPCTLLTPLEWLE